MAASPLDTVVAPTALVAAVSSATAIAINFATSDQASIWAWAAVLALTVLSFLASLWLHRRAQDAPSQPRPVIQVTDTAGDVRISIGGVVHTGPSQLLVFAVVLAVLAPSVLYIAVSSGQSQASGSPSISQLPSQTPTREPGSTPTPSPDADIRMHEIWASSADNERRPIDDSYDWAMTSFPVTVRYLRSIELAAGPNGQKVLLTVENAHEEEIAQAEVVVNDYRAKHVFETPVDLSDYVGDDLYLRVRNITGRPTHVYLSRTDRDPSIYTYFSDHCQKRTDAATSCWNKEERNQDLSVLAVGRISPW